jgi:hypothetical protein
VLHVFSLEVEQQQRSMLPQAATRGRLKVMITSAAVLTCHALVMNLLFFISTSRVYGSASVQNLHRARQVSLSHCQHLASTVFGSYCNSPAPLLYWHMYGVEYTGVKPQKVTPSVLISL